MSCPLCVHPIESIHHCLFACPHANEGWKKEWPTLPHPNPSIPFLEWLHALTSRYPICSIQKIIFLLWQTWKSRNERIFKNTTPWPPSTISKAASAHQQWTSCPKRSPTATLPTKLIPPPNLASPPPSSHDFEIHCDESIFRDPQEVAFGVVVMNSHGQVCDGKAESLHCFSPIEAEAKALEEGSRLAASLRSPCLVHSDCLTLVKALSEHRTTWPWRAAAWIGSIKQTLDNSPMIRIKHIGRKRNSMANWVARSCAKNTLPTEWVQILDVVSPLL
ncbi:unnamed protein product [Linum trigynum]|uniref:RNase H type-1 domain-containing protein n=1 Tax=Linum trigynum TaxID=586398 RepID=A0AAV2E9K1_9ROSI